MTSEEQLAALCSLVARDHVKIRHDALSPVLFYPPKAEITFSKLSAQFRAMPTSERAKWLAFARVHVRGARR